MKTRLGLGIVAALLVTVTAAGCGSDDEGPGVATAGGGGAPAATESTASDEEADREEQLRDFAQCMRDHGVDLPDPQPGTGVSGLAPWAEVLSGDDPTVQAAFEACQSRLPNGGEPPQLNPEQLEVYRNFAGCMRENGIDLPDPAADGTLQLRAFLAAGIDPEDPVFQAAFEACRSTLTGLLGAPLGGGGE